MKKNTLLYTNLIVCVVIVVGFLLTSIISHYSSAAVYKNDIENVANLVSDSIYSRVYSLFSKPIDVSNAMANNSFLKEYLKEEQENVKNEGYTEIITEYLNEYKKQNAYDTAFFISSQTNEYYHFDGENRTLHTNNPEDEWYFNALNQEKEYLINIDSDATAKDDITIFVNAKVKDEFGAPLGIIGVGFEIRYLEDFIKEYDAEFAVDVNLVDQNGIVQITSSDNSNAIEGKPLSENPFYSSFDKKMLDKTSHEFWNENAAYDSYTVVDYIEELQWYLVIGKDTMIVRQSFVRQMSISLIVMACIIVFVLLIITKLIKKYNEKIVEITVSQEMDYQRLLRKATEQLYENVYEFDVTNNKAASDKTRQYFKSFGIDENSPLDDALKIIAQKRVKEEYRQGYFDTFCQKNVLEANSEGISNLSYDFLAITDNEDYAWRRINAHMFFWNTDKSLRMISFHKNIDEEKRRELHLISKSQRDELTGFFNKGTAESLVEAVLKEKKDACAFIVFDIDNFKSVNDEYGHAFGDTVIKEFAHEIKDNFRSEDILGRIGGDEFIVLMKEYGSVKVVKEKLNRLGVRLRNKKFVDNASYSISSSIGVALFPDHAQTYSELFELADKSLYFSKNHGKNMFTIYEDDTPEIIEESGISQRDLETMLENATDGAAKLAFCEDKVSLLYINNKFAQLLGLSDEDRSDGDIDIAEYVHPDDVENLKNKLSNALKAYESFSVYFRIKKSDSEYILVKSKNFFVNELYKDKYPVFYAVHTDLSSLKSF